MPILTLSEIIAQANFGLDSLKDTIQKQIIKLDQVFPPATNYTDDPFCLGMDLNYAGADLIKPFYINTPHLPAQDTFNSSSFVLIKDYTLRPRERTKNLFNPLTGRFSIVHIPNLVQKFIEDNQGVFNPQDNDFSRGFSGTDLRQFERTSKNIRDRYVDMFNSKDLAGISEEDSFNVLTLDLRRRLWECVKTGNNGIDDIFRTIRHYDGFDLILPGALKFRDGFKTTDIIQSQNQIRPEPEQFLDEEGFNWKKGTYELQDH